ncbi:MAG: carbohydrate-binding protein [Candidatus Babeliales bacterium]|jgi:hypothetical protein
MTAQSNTEFPAAIQRWKDGQWVYFYNHKDNGVQEEEKAGSRYEADFTILNDLSLDAALTAITRKVNDPDLDQKVIDNIQVNGKEAILSTPAYATKVSTTVFPTLPNSGSLKKGEIYSYGNGAVMVVQKHTRTAYAPELTPDLFNFYRDNQSQTLDWVKNEKVEKGWERTYDNKTYECIQPHVTYVGYEPSKTPALWKLISSETIPVFVHPTGAHDVYMKGYKVHFPTITDPVYESLIDNNSWSPTEYPAGWKKII